VPQAVELPAGQLPRVLVISDVLLYREGIAAGLARSCAVRVVGSFCGAEARDFLARCGTDAVLLDASSAELLPLARAIHQAWPDLPLIGFGIGDDANSLACAEAGLIGFVGRDGTIADLICTVERALVGEVGCSARLAAMLCARISVLAAHTGALASTLTPREREIAELAAAGRSNKEIAIDLRIGPATVKNHIHNILDKLGAPRRAAIAVRLPPLAGQTMLQNSGI
jgi:two-component system nitrate/nitrite response regulator NarL